jgi:uncharacterized phiE125 gp8 family phage protein
VAGLKVIVQPAIEPVTLPEIKAQLRIDLSDDTFNDQINPLIPAAREWCEGYQNRAFITQTLAVAIDEWPCSSMIKLPRAPLHDVVSVSYADQDGNSATWPDTNYVVDDFSEPGYLVASGSWPSSKLPRVNGIVVTYVAGYGAAAENVPAKIKQAIILLVCHWYDNGMCDPPPAVLSLLNLDRVVPV